MLGPRTPPVLGSSNRQESPRETGITRPLPARTSPVHHMPLHGPARLRGTSVVVNVYSPPRPTINLTGTASPLTNRLVGIPQLDPLTAAPVEGKAHEVVTRFFNALNARDVSGIVSLFDEHALHEDLSHELPASGRDALSRFYSALVASWAERMRVVIDDLTDGANSTKVAATWHMEVDGMEVPLTRGLSFYRINPATGKICYVRQSPEHFIKVAELAMSANASAAPFIDQLGALSLPTFWTNLARGASTMLANAPPVDELLRNVAAAGASGAAAGTAYPLGHHPYDQQHSYHTSFAPGYQTMNGLSHAGGVHAGGGAVPFNDPRNSFAGLAPALPFTGGAGAGTGEERHRVRIHAEVAAAAAAAAAVAAGGSAVAGAVHSATAAMGAMHITGTAEPRVASGHDSILQKPHAPFGSSEDDENSTSGSGNGSGSLGAVSANNAVPIHRSPSKDALNTHIEQAHAQEEHHDASATMPPATTSAAQVQEAASAPSSEAVASHHAGNGAAGNNGAGDSGDASSSATEAKTLGLKPRMRDLPLPPGVQPYAAAAAATASHAANGASFKHAQHAANSTAAGVVAPSAAVKFAERPSSTMRPGSTSSTTGSLGSDNEDGLAAADPESSSRGSVSNSESSVAAPNSHNNSVALRFVPSISVDLSGIWVKDPERSQLAEYEKCIDLWGLSGVQKQTAKLLEGLEVTHRGGLLDVHFLTIIPMFKVTESYRVGATSRNRRRDLRSGDAVSSTRYVEQGLHIETSFGDSFPGNVEETYWSPEPGVLCVRSTIYVGDRRKGAQRSASTLQVYHRKNMSKSDFLKQSEKRNGNANDIIKQFGMPSW